MSSKYKRDILNYKKVHLDHLPRSRLLSDKERGLINIYQTYVDYLKHFPLWSRLQMPIFYASPTSSLCALLHLTWRKKAIQKIKAQEKEKQALPAKPSPPKHTLDEGQLVDRMRWMLVEDIRNYLVAWNCVPPTVVSVVSGRIALRLLTKPKGISLTELCLEEVGRYISREKNRDYDEMVNNMRLFAIEELPKISQKAWLTLAEWKGRSLTRASENPEIAPPIESLKKAVGVLKKEAIFARDFFTLILSYHGACLAEVMKERR